MLSSTSLIPLRSSPLPKPASEQNGPPPFRWGQIDSRSRFHSDKICDISYANIQGKESLIEKFRNSCVMDEDPTYRPKIFHSSGPLKGQEQELPPPTHQPPVPLLPPPKRGQGWCLTRRFPEPNNTRRKLRSIACARQIGFSPLPPRTGFTLGLFPPVAMRKTDTI
jgi:RNA recognition motif 2